MYRCILIISACIFLFACKSTPTQQTYSAVDTIRVINSQLESVDLYNSELTANKTTVYDAINGKRLFEIFPNISVESTEEKDDWCQVGIYIKASDEEFDSYKIQPNRKLYGINGTIIGQSFDTIDIWLDNGELAFIGGYTSYCNILEESKPEHVLEQYLNKNKTTKDELTTYIESFGFEKIELNKDWNYETYMIYESQIEDPSPMDRIILFFDKKGILKCTINSRNSYQNKYPKIKLKRARTLNNLGQLDKFEVQEISNQLNEIYNKVD